MTGEDKTRYSPVGAGLAIGVAIGLAIGAGVDAKQKKDSGDDR